MLSQKFEKILNYCIKRYHNQIDYNIKFYIDVLKEISTVKKKHFFRFMYLFKFIVDDNMNYIMNLKNDDNHEELKDNLLYIVSKFEIDPFKNIPILLNKNANPNFIYFDSINGFSYLLYLGL